MERFNSTLQEFLNIIKTNFPNQTEQIDKHYNIEANSDRYIHEFLKNCEDKGDDISTKNEIIFSRNQVLLNSVDFYAIWNEETLEDNQRENIWNYIHSLYIFAFEYIKEENLKDILKNIKKIGTDRNSLDEHTRTFLNIVDTLTNKYTQKSKSKNGDSDSKDDSSSEDEDDTTSDDPTGGFFNMPDMFNGIIGDLAKEIAQDLDPSKLDLSNPMELLQDLLSGNYDENNDKSGVGSLIKNIVSKIQNKLESGEISKDSLMEEAQNIMKSFKGGKKGKFNMFKKMMDEMNIDMSDEAKENMTSSEKDMYEQAQKIINNVGKNIASNDVHQLRKKMELMSTRDRLRKKLEEKKKLLEMQSQKK
jgi:hypothetical protein